MDVLEGIVDQSPASVLQYKLYLVIVWSAQKSSFKLVYQNVLPPPRPFVLALTPFPVCLLFTPYIFCLSQQQYIY